MQTLTQLLHLYLDQFDDDKYDSFYYDILQEGVNLHDTSDFIEAQRMMVSAFSVFTINAINYAFARASAHYARDHKIPKKEIHALVRDAMRSPYLPKESLPSLQHILGKKN
ncbi:hypothetical protein HZB00_03075 [Candidatus Woesearchaeota archaeon]|nr:hypothetical protein [Candidatus Woesearchaeota archaeon]